MFMRLLHYGLCVKKHSFVDFKKNSHNLKNINKRKQILQRLLQNGFSVKKSRTSRQLQWENTAI